MVKQVVKVYGESYDKSDRDRGLMVTPYVNPTLEALKDSRPVALTINGYSFVVMANDLEAALSRAD